VKIRFVKTRTTKNNVVYEELPEADDVERMTTGGLYILKSAIGELSAVRGQEPEYLYIEIQAG
jgi:hypothetical protein